MDIKHILTKHTPLVILTGALIGLFFIMYALKSLLLPFAVGLIIAYILLPVVSTLEQKLPRWERWLETRRIVVISAIYMITVGIVAVTGFFIVVSFISSFGNILNNIPQMSSAGLTTINNWTENIRAQLPPGLQQQMDALLLELRSVSNNAIRQLFINSINMIPSTISFIIGFAVLPVFLFYILKDWNRLSRSFYAGLPPGIASHTRGIITIISDVLGRFIRAQAIMGLVVGVMVFAGLVIMDVKHPLTLATIAAITEIIPMIGPWIGGIIAVLIILAIDPTKVLWVIVLFVGVQLIENNLLVPRIQGRFLNMHPAIVLVVLVSGSYIAGIWGMLLAVPLTATIIELYRYIHHAACVDDHGAAACELAHDHVPELSKHH
ncbi:MAG: AI-2E family transporter [Chloroflexi bacterium]|nr:AI-2E family transporter [Chloroflexota bacterium]